MCVCVSASVYTYIHVWRPMLVKLVILAVGDPKAPVSIGEREGATPFPGSLHFTLELYFVMLSVKQGVIKSHFLSLWYESTGDWTEVYWIIAEYSTHKANGPVYTPMQTCIFIVVVSLSLSLYFSLSLSLSFSLECTLIYTYRFFPKMHH